MMRIAPIGDVIIIDNTAIITTELAYPISFSFPVSIAKSKAAGPNVA